MRFSSYTDWHELPASADALFAVVAANSLFLSRQWFAALHAATRDAERSLQIASVVDGGRVLAMLPLVADTKGHWESLTHRYTPFYSVLVDAAHRQAALNCLAEGLGRLPLQSLRLDHVDVESRDMRELRRAMEARGFDSLHRFSAYNWIHPRREQSYDAYLRERPARLRNTIARKSRKLQREHGYEIRLYRGKDVEPALPDYHAAYAASWKANEQFATLFNGMAVALAVPDWTRLAVLYAAGQPVAAQLWFVAHRSAKIFRLAYDERWRSYSPGSILTAFLVRYVFERDEAEELDFLVGNESYKQDWMSERRERSTLMFALPRKPQGWAARLKARLEDGFAGR